MKNKLVNFVICVVTLAASFLLGACTKDAPMDQVYLNAEAKYVSVTKRGVLFNGQPAQINIRSNSYWTATLSEDAKAWLSLSKMGGDGDMDLELTIALNDGEKRTADVTFRTLDGTSLVVTISQNAVTDPFFYYKDTFGTGATMTDLAEMTFEPEGLGIFRGVYSAAGAYADSSSASEEYEGASGGNNILLKDAESFISYGAFNILKDNNFVLSFGSKAEQGDFDPENLKIYISTTGRADSWAEIPYERPTTGDWCYTRVPFYIKSGLLQVFVKVESATGGYRIDDLSLDEGDESGDTILFPEDIVDWIERIIFQENFEWLTTDKGTSAMPGSDGDSFSTQYSGNTHGWTADPNFVYVRPGFPKIGKTNVGGGMTTPKLTGLGEEMKNVVVEFDAAQYDADYDALSIVVKNAGVIASSEEVKTTINIGSRNAWAHFSVEIAKATKETQIQFMAGIPDATQSSNSKSNRFWLDNVKVYYKDKVTGPGTITADVESVTIPSDGKAQRVIIDATQPWSATASDEWVVCTPVSGAAGQTEVLISGATTSGTGRTSSVSFAIGEQHVEVAVVQSASVVGTPAAKFVDAEPYYVVFEWPRVKEATSHLYSFELYEGSTDGTPVWTVPSQQFKDLQYETRVAFPNLKPSTKYYFRVKALSADKKLYEDSAFSEFVSGSTTAVSTPDGAAILEMNFEGFRWGGDYMRGANGYRPGSDTEEKAATTFAGVALTRVTNAQTSVSDAFTWTEALRKEAGLEGWTGKTVYGHLGVAKLGGWKGSGWLMTPALEKISGTKDLNVSFKISAYIDYGDGKTSDDKEMTLSIEGPGTIEQSSFSMQNYMWTTCQTVIRGATSATKVKFNSSTKTSGGCRFMLDDIRITEGAASTQVLPIPAPKFAFSDINTLAFEWPRIESTYSGQKYAYELRKGTSTGIVVKSVTTQTLTDLKYTSRILFTHLEPDTKYFFTVKALSNNTAVCPHSDYSALVSGTTPAKRAYDADAILEMYFDGFIWGGDYMRDAYGFRPGDPAESTAVDTTPANTQVSPATSIGDYFNTGINPEFRNGYAGLAGWKGSKVYGLSCYAKLGSGGAQGWIETPALAKISGTKDIVVTFNVCPWVDYGDGKTPDSKSMKIEVSGGGTPSTSTCNMPETFKWTEQSVVITGATASTTVKFLAAGSSNSRFMIDDIKIVEKK